jgi:hypothetical protein
MKTLFNKQLVGPFIFFLSGMLFFAIGSGMTMRQRTLESQGIEVPGVVIDLQENYDSDGSSYTPVVQFRAKGGQSIEFVSSYSSSPPAYDVGESVTVVYPPDNPSDAIIKGDGQFLHIIFMLLGGVVAAIGFYLVFSTLRAAAIISPEE